MAWNKVCPICNVKFVAGVHSKVYCSQKCKEQGAEQKAIIAAERRKALKAMKQYKTKSIAEIAAEAREAGMTYGQYVQKMEL